MSPEPSMAEGPPKKSMKIGSSTPRSWVSDGGPLTPVPRPRILPHPEQSGIVQEDNERGGRAYVCCETLTRRRYCIGDHYATAPTIGQWYASLRGNTRAVGTSERINFSACGLPDDEARPIQASLYSSYSRIQGRFSP